MKITKFQNPVGKLIRVLGNALEQQLSKTGTKIFAGTQRPNYFRQMFNPDSSMIK